MSEDRLFKYSRETSKLDTEKNYFEWFPGRAGKSSQLIYRKFELQDVKSANHCTITNKLTLAQISDKINLCDIYTKRKKPWERGCNLP